MEPRCYVLSLCRTNICLVGDIPDILNLGHSVTPMRDGALMHPNRHEGDNDEMRCKKLIATSNAN